MIIIINSNSSSSSSNHESGSTNNENHSNNNDKSNITNDDDVGYHRLRSPGTTIKVWTCVKTPCSGTECSIPNHVCSGDIDISGL